MYKQLICITEILGVKIYLSCSISLSFRFILYNLHNAARAFSSPSRCFQLSRHICYLPAGRSVLGKTVPEVLSTARGRRPRAVLKTEGTVFPNTDRPRPANSVYFFLP